MSKTVKQIADELGVTKQAVHQKRKSKALSTALQPFTSIVDGVVYISVDGENLIKQAFSTDDRKPVDVNVDDNDRKQVDGLLTVLQDTISVLKDQLKEKDAQLAAKDQQIADLTAAVKAQAQSINADSHKELADTLQHGLLPEQAQPSGDVPMTFGEWLKQRWK